MENRHDHPKGNKERLQDEQEREAKQASVIEADKDDDEGPVISDWASI